MILSANQPYFLPYFPWWQLIAQAEIFLISDDYAFMKGSWVARNLIEINGSTHYFRLRIRDRSCHRTIAETEILPPDGDELLKTLGMAYHKAPFFKEGIELMERVLNCPERNLNLFLSNSIREICAYLGIGTALAFTSDFPGNAELKREERVYDLCSRCGADIYVNAIGGRQLYDKAAFASRGIELRFLQTETEEKLSIIHSIMHRSREELHEMLGDFRYV